MNREALSFWTRAYQAGCRIIHDGTSFQFQKAINYAQRMNLGGFGRFPEEEIIEPAQWVYQGLEEHEDGLLTILRQEPPKQYARFFYHLLVLDYEVRPIEIHALTSGCRIRGVAVNGGQFLWYEGVCERSKGKNVAPEPPHILAHLERIRV